MPHLPIGYRLQDLIDVLVVATAIYYILLWLRGTRAIQLIRGLILILAVYLVGHILGLYTINWLFDRFAAVIAVMLIIVFQPELRRTLEHFGRGRVLGRLGLSHQSHRSWLVRHLVRATQIMAENKVGAIIVLERNVGLSEYLESGVKIDALTSAELILSIFNTRAPLHDGAVVIQGDRLAAAGVLLPLTESRMLDKRLGTRHRAAVGISETTDALAIVVSERMGSISVAENGYLTRSLTREMLEEKLFNLYSLEMPKGEFFPWKWWGKKIPKE